MERKLRNPESGVTLIEVMIAGGILAIGMVVILNAVINWNFQTRVSEIRTIAVNFNNSVLETIRGRDIQGIVKFNQNGVDLNSTNGVVDIPGLEDAGTARIKIFAVFDGDTANAERVEIPMSDETIAYIGTFPNPIEIQLELTVKRGSSESGFVFRTSSLIFYP